MMNTDPINEPEDSVRRGLMRQAACVAAAFAAGAVSPRTHAAGVTKQFARSQLVNAVGRPLNARQIKPGEPWLFNYPYEASPVFLIALDAAPATTELATRAQQRYEAPKGVGPAQTIVAFSAICAHKMMYPTAQVSFIGLRPGRSDEPAHVIHCCGDDSRYDPTRGARVIAGPAPQPLAAVLLEWDDKHDHLYATGVQGGDMFQSFFEKYAFKLELEHGQKARALTAAQAPTRPAAEYSRQWQSCRA